MGSNSGGSQTGATNNGTTNNGAESPRPSRKRFGSASEETILKQVNGDGLSIANAHDLEALKADLLREMRIEINKATKEIIDGNYRYIHSYSINLAHLKCEIIQFFSIVFFSFPQLSKQNLIEGKDEGLVIIDVP